MVKVTLVEGWHAYIGRGWTVMPVWDDKNHLTVGICRVVMASGIALIVRGSVKDIADELEADSLMPMGAAQPGSNN